MRTLTNNGRRRLGVPGHPAVVLNPGESTEISDASLAIIGRNRTVARWLQSGVLTLSGSDGKPAPAPVAPEKEAEKQAESPPALPEGVTGEGTEVHHRGGGWWDVYVSGFKVTDGNNRKDEAEAIAAEYEAE